MFMEQLNMEKDNIKSLVTTLNEKGFILEDKTEKILTHNFPQFQITRNIPIVGCEKKESQGNDLAEIDFVIENQNTILFMECKRTSFTWFFPKNASRKNLIYSIIDTNEGIKCQGTTTSKYEVVYSDLALRLEKGIVKTSQGKSETSYSDVHKHINQVLRAMQISLSTIGGRNRFIGKALYPVIITNTNLYMIKYNNEDLTNSGDLKESLDSSSIQPVPYVAYNFPKIMGWDTKNSQEIHHEGIKESLFSDHLKTIFIVDVKSLVSFMENLP